MKKQAELEYNETKLFLESAKIDFDNLQSIEKDPPDLFFYSKNLKISIEHTRLNKENGQKIQPIYKTYNLLIAKTREKYELLQKPPIIAQFRFTAKVDTSGNKIEKIATEVLNIILPYLNNTKEYKIIEIPIEKLPEFLRSITLITGESIDRNSWSCKNETLVWGKQLTTDILTPSIDKKNNTLLNTKYFEQYNESWLLLIDEGKAWSAFSNDKPKDFILKSEWKFDKVFVFCLFDYSYQQLM